MRDGRDVEDKKSELSCTRLPVSPDITSRWANRSALSAMRFAKFSEGSSEPAERGNKREI
jgi:hypothetical protein